MKKINLYSLPLIITGVTFGYSWTSSAFAAPAPIIISTQDRTVQQESKFGIGVITSIVK